MDRSPCVSRDCRVECVIDPIHARLAESLWPAQRRDREITPAWSPSASDGVRHAAALSGGRSWWTHHEFTRINIEPTFQKEEFEEVREAAAIWLPRPSGSYSGAASLPLPFRLLQPLSHLLVIRGVQRPPLCRAVPAVVPDRHIDTAVDEELHGRVVRMKDKLVQDARRLMGA